MAKKLKINAQGFKDVRTSPKVRDELLKRAKKIAEAAGGEAKGFKVTELVLERNRAAVSVLTTGHALHSNRKHHNLLRALDARIGPGSL